MSSLSNSVPKFEYDVVVTWNAESTEDSQSLVFELCEALTVPGLDVLREPVYNSTDLQAQKVRPPSRISLIVFCKDFHLSESFLQTFLTILDSTCAPEYILLPVFYDVDSADIGQQTGSSSTALYERWRVALRRVLDFTGFHFFSQKESDKPMLIKHIVGFIVDGLEKNNISSWCHRECHLMDSGLSLLPEIMTFPVLTKLFLQDNCNLSEIPQSFFLFMPCLQVLDMSRTNIKHLPPSIAHLGQLKELLLRGCKLLMELPSQIQALTNLKVFDLEGTEVICIPKEIEMLRKLECLVVSLNDSADEYMSETMENGEIIPSNTISKLTNLKLLSIFVDQHCKWWNAEVEFIIQDLINLQKLEELNLYFPTVDLLQSFVQLSRVKCGSLSNFRFIVGCHDQVIVARVPQVLVDRFETLEKSFKYVNDRGNIERVGEVLKHASAFYLDRHWTIDRLSRFKSSEVDKLRFCLLVECNEMINVIDNRGDSGGKTGNSGEPVLGLLQHLSIYYMKIMESIFVGPLARGSLHRLQTLDIHTCPKLSTVFTFGLLSCLVNLKELIVEDCPKLESIIVSEESLGFEFGKEFLPNLEKISLLHLPGLVSISSGLRVAPRLVSMVIYNCPRLQSISLVEISSANIIKEIKGEKEWWGTLDWTSGQLDYLHHVFVPFTREGLINQLVEARNSWSTLNMSSSSTRKQDQLDTDAKSTLPHHKERRGQIVAVSSDFGDQGYGGVEPRSNNSIPKTSEILVTQKSNPKQGLSLNAGDVNREANVVSRHYPGGPLIMASAESFLWQASEAEPQKREDKGTVPTYRQTKEISSVDGSKTNAHQSTVVDRSIERSPLHTNYLRRVANKDKHFERKDLGSGVRSRRASTSAYGDENKSDELGARSPNSVEHGEDHGVGTQKANNHHPSVSSSLETQTYEIRSLENSSVFQKDPMQNTDDSRIPNRGLIGHSSESIKTNRTLEPLPVSQAAAETAGFSHLSSPSPTSFSPSSYQNDGEYDRQFNLSGQGLMPVAEVKNPVKQDLVVKIREHEQEITQLRKHLSEYLIKESQIRNEKYVLEKRIAYMRMAFDQQQQDLVDAASKALSYRQDIIEENIRLTYALQDAQQERSTFVSSLMHVLAEYSLEPPVADAQSIVSNLKVLFKHLQEKLLFTEAKLKESQYQLPPWRSDANLSNFSQSPSHSAGNKNGLALVTQQAYSDGQIPISSDPLTTREWDGLGHHQSGLGDGVAGGIESDEMMGRYSHLSSRNPASHEHLTINQGDSSHPMRNSENTTTSSKQVKFNVPFTSSEMDDPEQMERDPSTNWSQNPSYTTIDDNGSSYSPYLPPVLEEPSSSFSEVADDDPLPAVEGLQISGEPFPGRELQASGYSINGTTSCNFEWVRHLEDGSVKYIDGAKQPGYLVSADDVDTYLAIEVQPMDDRKRKGELVKVFVNDNRKITCDPELHKHIERNVYNGHATYRVSLSTRYLDIWEPATLAIKREGYSVKCTGPNAAVITEKFSTSTIVNVPCGNPTDFSINGTGGTEHVLRADESSQDITCSRDAIVLTLRLFIIRAREKKKGKKRGLFFNK